MSRHDLTDREWKAIRVYLPKERNGKPGRPWKAHRVTISGILWITCVGAAWRDLRECFGKWQTVYNRFRRWQREGIWDRIWRRLLHRLDRDYQISRKLWCVDSTVIRAHRCAAGGSIKTQKNADENGLGRSRGGYSSKLHLACDELGTPLGFTVTAGQRGESPEFENVLHSIPVSIHRWKKRPRAIAGDKAYSSYNVRTWIREHGIQCVIPTRSNERPKPGLKKKSIANATSLKELLGDSRNSAESQLDTTRPLKVSRLSSLWHASESPSK